MRALHVNYGLRGAESDADERHCAALCEQLGVELEIVRVSRGQGETGNLQAWARDVRYTAAIELAERDDALVAAGHTASDQVETILYRLAASPGRRALLGMRADRGATGPPAARRHARADEGVLRSEGIAAGARTRATTATRTRAYASDMDSARRCGRCTRRPRRTCCGPRSLLREETELLDGLVAETLAGEREHRARAPGRAGDGAGALGRGRVSPSRRRARTCPRRAIAWRRSWSWAGAPAPAAAVDWTCTSAAT